MRLFARLLALALLLHQAWWDGFEVSGRHGLVVLAAFVVLARPGVASLLALCLAESVSVWRDMPGAGSHTLLAAVCAAALVAWSAAFTARRRRPPNEDELWTAAAPFLRGAVVVLYLFAALAKLNPGYFDPAVSCGAALAPRIAWFDPALLDLGWVRTLGTYGSVATELALPVLLLVPRTRLLGVALGVGFHTVLALAGNVPFSALMLALYVAFLPPVRLPSVPAWPAVVLALGWLLLHLLEPTQEAIGTGTRLVLLAVVLGLVASVRRTDEAPAPVPRRSLVLVGALALLVLNGSTPYLGLKTESSFAMYSNLQTEGSSWNHALIPEAVQRFGIQDDLVTVSASSDPLLARRTRGGTRMVRFELERYLRLHPGTRATVAGGELAGARGNVVQRVVDKVAKFRDVRPPERRGC